jgi:hypothetical protein
VFAGEPLTRNNHGRAVAAHRERTMPVWGDAFRVSPGGLTSEEVDTRIAAIVRYLRGIQQRPAE